MVQPKALRGFTPRVGPAPEPARRHLGDEVVSIIPAPGWRARFEAENSAESYVVGVACWAMVNRFGRVIVVGMMADPWNTELTPVPVADPGHFRFVAYETDGDE